VVMVTPRRNGENSRTTKAPSGSPNAASNGRLAEELGDDSLTRQPCCPVVELMETLMSCRFLLVSCWLFA
jgi:hypothetical protein